MVTLNLKKPMIINFVNKQACKISGYEHQECIGLSINAMMSQVISDNHLIFINEFLRTGRSRFINK
jgi:PAS domain S-box-containing protein